MTQAKPGLTRQRGKLGEGGPGAAVVDNTAYHGGTSSDAVLCDLHPPAWALRSASMRDLDIIDSELRLLAAVRWACQEVDGRVPSMTLVDALPDERGELTGRSAGCSYAVW
jgi:hypothetical protein